VVLRVQLDEGKTEDQLKQLVLDIEKTRAAQAALSVERRKGIVTDDEFSKKTVDLRTLLKGQVQEQANLTKNLELYRAAQNGQVDSYKATQSALSLAIRQQQELAGSADDSTEASQALTKQIAAYREQLAQTDEKQNAFFRRIGDYGRGTTGLKELTQQLVQLEEEQKRFVMGSDQELKVRNQIGFLQTAAIQKAAQEGKSYEEATNFIRTYGNAIRPAAADLVKLAEQQRQAAESGETLGEEMQQIGFKIGAAKKQIQDATKALEQVPTETKAVATETKKAGEQTDSFGKQLLEAASGSDKLGETIEVLTGAKEKYTIATNLAKAAVGGEATALGVLKGALIATGLGALVVLLGLIVGGLLKSQAATDFLSRKMAALGGAIQPLLNIGAELADTLIAAADNPKKAFSDFLDFLGQNVLNRLKAVGQLVKDIINGNFSKLGDDVIQFGTGIVGATGKLQALGAEMQAAAKSAEAIAVENQRIRESERALNVERDQSRAKIEGLKKLADDTTKSIAARTTAAKQAAAIENGLLAEQEKLQDDKIANLKAEQALKKSLSSEDKDALAELQRERAQSTQESLTLQTELQNTLNGLVQEGIDKRIEARQQALDLERTLLDKQLATVKLNSDEELSLQQRKLRTEYEAEINVNKLTIAQKKKAQAEYETQSLALSLDFNRRRLVAALQAQVDLTAAELSQQRAGGNEALGLQTAQIENQRRLAIAGLAANADNSAKIAAINATAAQQRQKAEYDEAVRLLQEHLEQKRQQVELDYAKGITKEGEYQRQLAAVQKAGIDLQANLNKDYNQDNATNEKAAADYEISQAQRVKEEKKKIKETEQQIQDAAFQAAAQTTDLIIDLFGKESAAGQAALITKKTLAIAEIAINLQKQLALNKVTGAEISAAFPPPLGPILGTAYVIANDALAIAAAASGTASILKLQRGGIALGPSHEEGGIPLTRRGWPTGIEIEGGEPVLTANVTRNPLLLSIASLVNQAAGGRALVSGAVRPHLALGGISTPLVQQQLTGNVQQPLDYDRLALALSRINVKATIQDVEAGLERKAFTNSLGNS